MNRKKPEYFCHDVESFDSEKGEVVLKRTFKINEKGKTTWKGDYAKLNPDHQCKFPERADCNSGIFYRRCPHMTFVSIGIWKCNYEK